MDSSSVCIFPPGTWHVTLPSENSTGNAPGICGCDPTASTIDPLIVTSAKVYTWNSAPVATTTVLGS